MELAIYYEQSNSLAELRPDVQLVFGVGRGDRSVFELWEEGKASDFVLEVPSPSTAGEDAWHKARQYPRIGVREYWRLDPEGSLMGAPLESYRARGGRHERIESVAGASTCGAGVLGWTCAASGASGRWRWCCGIRGRARSSTAPWRHPGGSGGWRRIERAPHRTSWLRQEAS